MALPVIVERLNDKDSYVRQATIKGLSTLGASGMNYVIVFALMYQRLFVAEWQEDIRTAIPGIVECLNEKDSWVRQAAVEGLSMLGAQGMDYITVFTLMYWKLFAAELKDSIQTAIPGIMKCLKDNDKKVCQSAIEGLSRLGAQGMAYVSVFVLMYLGLFVAELKYSIQAAIPGIVQCLKDEDHDVRWAATEGLSRLGAHGMDYFSAFRFDVLIVYS